MRKDDNGTSTLSTASATRFGARVRTFPPPRCRRRSAHFEVLAKPMSTASRSRTRKAGWAWQRWWPKRISTWPVSANILCIVCRLTRGCVPAHWQRLRCYRHLQVFENKLICQGYDPLASADALYFDSLESEAFVQLDKEFYDRIQSGGIRF